MAFEKVSSTLDGNEHPEEALEEDGHGPAKTYSSKDAQYHAGLGAGAIIAALGYSAHQSFASGRYLLGLTSAGTAAMFAKLGGGLALRSYLKLGGKSLVKSYNALSPDDGEEQELFDTPGDAVEDLD
ncbi:MAG: hypothetical protein ABEJ98_02615 [Candidatus Nanohaloarchaea archaeon]